MVDPALASQLDLAEGVPLQPNARYAVESSVGGADLAADGSVQGIILGSSEVVRAGLRMEIGEMD